MGGRALGGAEPTPWPIFAVRSLIPRGLTYNKGCGGSEGSEVPPEMKNPPRPTTLLLFDSTKNTGFCVPFGLSIQPRCCACPRSALPAVVLQAPHP